MAGTGPSTRTIVRVFLTVAGLAVALYFLYLIRHILLLVAIAIFVAMALGPAVDAFARRGMPRALSILLVYLLIGLAIIGVGLLVVPPIVSQVQSFADKAPTYVKDARKNQTLRKYDKRYHIFDKLEEQAGKLPQRLGSAAGALRDVTVGVFSTLVELVTVLTMAFFLLLDGGRVIDFAADRLRPQRAARARTVARDVYRSISGYVAGNLLISIIAGTVTWITLTVLGVPFAVPLAVLMAFLDLIPLVGATLGAIAIGIVTLFNDFPTSTIIWVLVAIVYQQIENNAIQPVVYRRTVDVHPLIVIISILIGAALIGVLGALLAIPVAAGVQIVVLDLWRRRGPSGDLLVVAEPEGEHAGEPGPLVRP